MSEHIVIAKTRKAVEEAWHPKGMSTHDGKVTIDASHADWLLKDIDRLKAELEVSKLHCATLSERYNELERQLTEAKTSAEAWQENCRLTEEELENERDKHASTIGKLADANRGAERNANINRALADKLAERDAEIETLRHQSINWVPVFDANMELQTENAALREEVEKIREANRQLAGAAICPDHLKPENVRKQTAQEILDSLTQEEVRRIISVGDPRVTTISSKLLAMMAELRQRYGLEG